MDKFREVFKAKHVVLFVIHVKDLTQTLANVALAKNTGADGAFLINHHKTSYHKLLDIFQFAGSKFPGFWMGVNLLGFDAFCAFDAIFKKGLKVSGVWADNAKIDEFVPVNEQYFAQRVKSQIESNNWGGLYFGGVAFKYQRQVRNFRQAARIAAYYMDAVTTSGPATGQAAEVEKIRQMKEAVSNVPLAIASGITPENVKDYLGLADCFLVATGISKDFYTLDEEKAKRLIGKVREIDG